MEQKKTKPAIKTQKEDIHKNVLNTLQNLLNEIQLILNLLIAKKMFQSG